MKKTLLVCLSLLLIAAVLSGCAEVTKKLDQIFPENSEVTTVTDDPDAIPMPERTGRVYTVLVATRAETDLSMTTLSLLTFDTAVKSVHWLQMPTNLFVHTADTTLDGVFSSTYRNQLATPGNSEAESTHVAMQAVRDLLSKGMNIPIDYYVSFDPDQLASLVTTLQGIPVALNTPTGGFGEGEIKMEAKDVRRFLSYNGYAEATQEKLEARRIFSTALWKRAVEIITPENLTLYASQLRLQMITDIPVNGGEDIFFWRRFLQADPAAVEITRLSTQSIYYNNVSCQVLNRINTLRQLNEQMGVYGEALADALFDAERIFVDDNNALIRTVYQANSPLPEVYTMAEPVKETPAVSE